MFAHRTHRITAVALVMSGAAAGVGRVLHALVPRGRPDYLPLGSTTGQSESLLTEFLTSARWMTSWWLLLVGAITGLIGIGGLYLRLRARRQYSRDIRFAMAGGAGLTAAGLLLLTAAAVVQGVAAPIITRQGDPFGAARLVNGTGHNLLDWATVWTIVGLLALGALLLWTGTVPRWATPLVVTGVAFMATPGAALGALVALAGLAGWSHHLWTDAARPPEPAVEVVS